MQGLDELVLGIFHLHRCSPRVELHGTTVSHSCINDDWESLIVLMGIVMHH